MALRDVRVIARTGLNMTADVYDATDTLLQSVTMTAIANTGIYRADLTVATGHWVHAHSAQGTFSAIVRLAPSAADLLRLGWSRVGSTLIFTDISSNAVVKQFTIPGGTPVNSVVDQMLAYLAQDITVQVL